MYRPHAMGFYWQSQTEINPAPAPACAGAAGVARAKEAARCFCHQHSRQVSRRLQRCSGKHSTALLRMGLNRTGARNELVIFINTAGRIKHMAWDKQLKTSSMYI